MNTNQIITIICIFLASLALVVACFPGATDPRLNDALQCAADTTAWINDCNKTTDTEQCWADAQTLKCSPVPD